MKKDDVLELDIVDLDRFGGGIGKAQGLVIFVPGALIGERVVAKIANLKKNYAQARLVRLIKKSSHRVDPICPLFGRCGGCQIMHLDYKEQLIIKERQVRETIKRIGKLEHVVVHPCRASPQPLAYRNKIQLPIGPGKIGLFERNSHKIVDVKKCFIHASLGEKVYEEISDLFRRSKLTVYDEKTGRGELRFLQIRTAVQNKGVLVCIVTAKPVSDELKKLAETIMQRSPDVLGVVHGYQPKKGNTSFGLSYKTLCGEGVLMEKLLGNEIMISPASFFQVNAFQAKHLYNKALELANLDGSERVLDAYCGIGTFTIHVAKHSMSVVGIECVDLAIRDAVANAKRNKVSNCEFICGLVEKKLQEIKNFDVVFLNPPRKGCDKEVLQAVVNVEPKSIIYTSCDPATLARDLSLLAQRGYSEIEIFPFDMFAQTTHVECVVKIRKS